MKIVDQFAANLQMQQEEIHRQKQEYESRSNYHENLIQELKSQIKDLNHEHLQHKNEIDGCAKMITDVIVKNNLPQQHERSSGSLVSPAGRLADKGVFGMPLHGSFESGKK